MSAYNRITVSISKNISLVFAITLSILALIALVGDIIGKNLIEYSQVLDIILPVCTLAIIFGLLGFWIIFFTCRHSMQKAKNENV